MGTDRVCQDANHEGMSEFARTIYSNKYAMKLNGRKEVWPETAHRVASSVMGAYLPEMVAKVTKMITQRKLMPGGRYLYAAGRKYPQVNNCMLFSAEDSREGWADLMSKITNCLMTGGGIGVVYSKLRAEGEDVKGMGGKSTGPLALMRMVNEAGRYIMQGGSRRSAIWAGLHWTHADIFKFIKTKEWSNLIRQGKREDFNFPGQMDMTNISVILDDEFFTAYHDKSHPKYDRACDVYWEAVRHMLRTGEPGFSVDIGENAGEHCRNAPVAADTMILVGRDCSDTRGQYTRVGDIVGREVMLWTRTDWVPATFTKTRENSATVRVGLSSGKYIVCSPDHEFILSTGERVQAGAMKTGDDLMVSPPYGESVQTSVIAVTRGLTQDVFCCDVKVADHSFMAEGVIISNCTEVTSSDDSDMCNLASLNMARISSKEELAEVAEAGIAFLLCGTLYSKLPVEGMYRVREKNRRLGLGLMGLHEWLLKRGKPYGPDDELASWMTAYTMSGAFASRWADRLSCSRPVATRSVAPTGTISIVAETTSGIEPIFASALKRRYLDGKDWKAQYIVDATAQRLIESGVDPDLIEDSMTLAEDVERRMGFQAWLQERVDHGIASTINLPPWGSSINNESTVTRFGNTLLNYLPLLRGITTYPDGARDGQPLVKAPYREAIKHLGVEFLDQSEEGCKGGVCGS